MKIKMLKTVSGDLGFLRRGDVHDVPDDYARKYIDLKRAEAVDEKPADAPGIVVGADLSAKSDDVATTLPARGDSDQPKTPVTGEAK